MLFAESFVIKSRAMSDVISFVSFMIIDNSLPPPSFCFYFYQQID